MAFQTNTRDIGFAIRDFLEGMDISAFTPDGVEGYREKPRAHNIEFIDVSDPNNLKIYLDNRQIFIVRILAE